MNEYTIRIEAFMVNPPKPCGLVVCKDNKIVASLTIEQVREAVRRWDEMTGTAVSANEGQ